MIFHWLTTGWRSLIANPLFSAITIASLSIGCCGALLVGANIKQHLTFERWVPDAQHVYIVTRKQDDSAFYGQGAVRLQAAGGIRPQATGPYKMAEAIDGKIPGIAQTARVARFQSLLPPDPSYPTTPPQPGDPPRTPPPGSVFVDEAFFSMFGLEFVAGSISGLSEPSGIIITQTAARRLFGESSALGQMVEGQNKRQFRVMGVVRDLPPETHLRFEAIGGMRLLRQIMDAEAADNAAMQPAGTPMPPSRLESWDGFFATTYIRSTPDVDPRTFSTTAKKAIQAVADEREAARKPFDPFAGPATATFAPAGAPTAGPPAAGPTAAPPAPSPPRPPTAGSTGPAGPNPLAPPPPPPLNFGYTYNVVPVLDIHLGGPELTSMNSSGDIKLLTTLGTAALALLAVSAFNYVTLSLARSLRRRREVAVRKVLGASQGTLVVHYIAESAIVTAISLAVGFALAFLLAPWFARLIGQPETLFDLGDPAFLVGTLVAFVVLAFAVGGYPAFYLAHTRPRTALGEGGAASHGRIGQWVTGGLMGLQISAAAVLLIVSMTMNAQADYIANRSMGYEVKDRYQVSIPCFIGDSRMPPEKMAQMMTQCRTATRSVLSQMKDVGSPAYFNGQLMTDSITLQAFGRAAKGEKLGEAARLTVDLTFLETVGSKLLAGRLFDPNSAYDGALTAYNNEMMAAAVTEVRTSPGGGINIMTRPPPNFRPTHTMPARVPVIVTRALVPMLGVETPQDAIGIQISNQPNAAYPFEIIGVIEDWNQRPLKYAVHPIIFTPGSAQSAVIRVDKDQVDSVRDRMGQIWKNMAGQQSSTPTLRPLQQTLEQSYRSDFQLMSAVTSFALVAIIVAGMGVFGLSAFEMRRRVREIGIRKALGASPVKVAFLVIGRAMAFAAIATVVAWPIGLLIANEWLSGFVYRTSLGPLVLPIASAAVIAFVAAAVAFSALRAAAIRPGLALRV